MDRRTKQSDLDRLLAMNDDDSDENDEFGPSMREDDLALYSSNEFTSKPPVTEGIFSSTLKNAVKPKDRYGGDDDYDGEEEGVLDEMYT
jgi:hypothetical protein